jgi:dihydroorotate dehydrogenase (NAD+) catalytic subunit
MEFLKPDPAASSDLAASNPAAALDMSVEIGPLKLKNPVMTASGTFGSGEEFAGYMDLNALGAVVVKGVSLKPSQGNPPPRIWETSCGMLNAIGLQNVGVEAFINEKLPFLRRFDTKVIVNFFGNTVEEFVEAAARLSDAEGVSALEMNVSCPNKQAGWISFGTDPVLLSDVVSRVARVTRLPLIVKLSPNVTDITVAARAAMEAGADALSLINTLTGMAIDVETGKPRLANVVGGLSGPAIKPVAVRMVWEVFKRLRYPIIGMGGIMSGQDAVEFMLAGASAVAVGTANFINPAASVEVLKGVESYLARKGIFKARRLTGAFMCEK